MLLLRGEKTNSKGLKKGEKLFDKKLEEDKEFFIEEPTKIIYMRKQQ